MYLNKQGWGLREMLVLSGVLVLFLVIAIYYIYNLFGDAEEYNANYYYELEEKLEHQANIYLNDYFDDDLSSDYITITRNILRAYDLDIALKDSKGDACSGYVMANKSKGKVNIKSYIKCNKYMTSGYEDWRE